jgi:hypothetical protein
MAAAKNGSFSFVEDPSKKNSGKKFACVKMRADKRFKTKLKIYGF